MQTAAVAIEVILSIAGVIGVIWTIGGLPIGLVLLVLKAKKKVDMPHKRLMLLTFGGIGLLVVSLILFFILNVILGFFGIKPPQPLPVSSNPF